MYANLILANEINRTALFIVVATQNPVEQEGTKNKIVNAGINTGAVADYARHWLLEAGLIQFSDEPRAAGVGESK